MFQAQTSASPVGAPSPSAVLQCCAPSALRGAFACALSPAVLLNCACTFPLAHFSQLLRTTKVPGRGRRGGSLRGSMGQHGSMFCRCMCHGSRCQEQERQEQLAATLRFMGFVEAQRLRSKRTSPSLSLSLTLLLVHSSGVLPFGRFFRWLFPLRLRSRVSNPRRLPLRSSLVRLGTGQTGNSRAPTRRGRAAEAFDPHPMRDRRHRPRLTLRRPSLGAPNHRSCRRPARPRPDPRLRLRTLSSTS